MVSNSVQIRRFRGTRKRLERLKLSAGDKFAGVAVASFCLLCALASAWLVVTFRE